MATIMDRINAEFAEDALASEPCGCYACDNDVQPGHFACSAPNEYMLKAEAAGLVSRAYTDERQDGSRSRSSAWRWFAA